MDTNFEAIKSLVELLVKKAGFSIEKNLSEDQYKELKELLKKYDTEESIKNKLVKQKNKWECNSEILGKTILKEYKEGKNYSYVSEKIDVLLKNISILEEKNHDSSLMSYIYNSIYHYNEKLEKLEGKINSNEIQNTKTIDMKDEIENIISCCEKEIEYKENIIQELKNKIEIYNKLNGKVNDLIFFETSNMKLLDETEEKIQDIDLRSEVLEKYLLNRKDINQRIEGYKKKQDDIKLSQNNIEKLIDVIEHDIKDLKKEIDKYALNDTNVEIVNLEQLIDEIKVDCINNKLCILKNQRDVIYVNSLQVKEELEKEWSKTKKIVYKKEEKNENKEEIKVDIVVKNKENKEKIELDW